MQFDICMLANYNRRLIFVCLLITIEGPSGINPQRCRIQLFKICIYDLNSRPALTPLIVTLCSNAQCIQIDLEVYYLLFDNALAIIYRFLILPTTTIASIH